MRSPGGFAAVTLVGSAALVGGLVAARAGGLDGGAATPGGGDEPERGSEAGDVYERAAVEVMPAKGVVIDGVSIENRFGDVRVEGHDGTSVIILAYKRAPDDETLDRVKVSLVSDPSGPIRIATNIASDAELRPMQSGAVRVDLVIRAPRNARVDARIWNGRLELEDMDAGGDLDANEGAIVVRNVSGPVMAHNALGDQVFTAVFGALEAQGIDGNVSLDTVRGNRLEASVQHGNIDGVHVRAKHLELRTTRGDIKLAGEALLGGTYRLSSAYGDLEVSFAAEGALTVWALARDGTVATPGGMKRRERDGEITASLGHSKKGSAIELRSRHGDIRFSLLEATERND